MTSLFHNLFGRNSTRPAGDFVAARKHIADQWSKLERHHPKDSDSLLALPNPYLVPASEEGHEFDFNELYYWDSYFMIQGLLDAEHKELVVGILENLESLFKRFGIIPNASRAYLTGRSQPPFLTSFIFDIYDAYGMDTAWLEQHIAIAEEEYKTVWMGKSKPNWRLVHKGLSRYYDINMLHDLAEAESGWDMTPRFGRRALDYLPVDLNALLYKYEADFARAAHILGNEDKATEWEETARQRADTMAKLMWDPIRGLFYDYNFVKRRRSTGSSLATFFPLWAGMVTDKQAKSIVQKGLKRFEQRGGLSTTDAIPLGQYVPGGRPMQWAYPNGWAPLHLIAVRGMQRYGYDKEAKRIAEKWLKTNLDWFTEHGMFLEKYNVVSPGDPPAKGLYPTQTGFGWTNAVFERFCQEYIDSKDG